MVCTMEQLFKNMGVWVDKPVYEEAERLYYEKLAKVGDVELSYFIIFIHFFLCTNL